MVDAGLRSGKVSFGVENGVYHRGGGPGLGGVLGVGTRPGFTEVVKSVALALRTGAVTRGEGGGLIEEEKFGVLSGRHNAVFAPFKFEQAGDPPLPHIWAANLFAGVMQTAPVAHERAAGRVGDQVSKGCYTVLAGHREIIP